MRARSDDTANVLRLLMEAPPQLVDTALPATSPAPPPLRSSLKRRTPDTGPPWSSPLPKSSRSNTASGSRVKFGRRVKQVVGTAEQLDRSGHDAFVCDGCAAECNRWEADKPPGRWHCLACDDAGAEAESYDLCRRCFGSLGAAGAVWPHSHGRDAFVLEDEPTESEAAEAAECARLVEEADSGAKQLAFGSPVPLR